MFLLALGTPLSVLGGWMPLAASRAAHPAVLVVDADAILLTMGVGMALGGMFGLWATRRPRTTMFKAAAFSLAVLFAPLVLVSSPLAYGALCGLLLRASGYERCASPELERAYATGTGRNRRTPVVFAHPRDGGCTAALARLGPRW